MSGPAPAPPPAPAGARTGASPETVAWRIDATALAVVAAAVRLPSYLAAHHLSFDDGVYGASALAMRDGDLPFRDIFSSQGPLHLPLVALGDLLGGRTAASPRTVALAAGVMATVATYAVGRRVATRAGAWLAAGLVSGSGSVLWATGPITSDGTTVALAVVAWWLALRHRDRPRPATAAAVGAIVAAGILVKPALGFLVALPVAILLARAGGRRTRDLSVAAVSAVVVGVLVTAASGFDAVWDQAIAYQLDSEREQSVAANARKVWSTLVDRDPVLLTLAALAAGAAIAGRGRRDHGARPLRDGITGMLALWLGLVLVFLVLEPALWRNHLAAVIPPAALLLARHPPPPALLAFGLTVAIPIQAVHLSDLLVPSAPSGPPAAARAALAALPDDVWVVTDDPGFAWRAGHRTPADLADTSFKRIDQGRLTTRSVLEESSRTEVCAVLVWSSRQFGALPGLAAGLADADYERAQSFDGGGGARELWLRPRCTRRGP